jgi:hypothetical protein
MDKDKKEREFAIVHNPTIMRKEETEEGIETVYFGFTTKQDKRILTGEEKELVLDSQLKQLEELVDIIEEQENLVVGTTIERHEVYTGIRKEVDVMYRIPFHKKEDMDKISPPKQVTDTF